MSGSEEQIERVARAICEVDCGRITENELDRCRDLARAAITAMQSEGIPIYRTEQGPTETFEVTERGEGRSGEYWPTKGPFKITRYTKCVTCGQSFDLQDPEQVAYHDSERHEPMAPR